MASPNQEQVDIAKALLPLMEKMAGLADKIKQSQSDQLETMKKMAEVCEKLADCQNVGTGFSETSKNVSELSGQVEKLNDESKNSISTMIEQAEQTEKNSNKFKALTKSTLMATGAITGLWQGLKNLFALGRTGFGFLAGMTKGLLNFGASVVSFPFKILGGLVNMAGKSGGGTDELRVQVEKLREEFGALGQDGPQAIMKTAKSMEGFSDTGLKAYRIFGTVAERLEKLNKLSQAMGATFGNLTEEFEKSGGALLGFQKGLGLSDEAMKGLAQRATAMGTKLGDQLMDVHKQADTLGSTFGIATKHIARDIAKAVADVKNFGGATIKQMGTASVYARKLGVELDKIVGTLGAFETFEGAAENASKMSQAFGVNIDAFKMMEAQDPATQIDMLRKSFAAAGQDASKFSRQQLKLLATSTGLDEATAKQAFSLKNQGVSLDKIKSASEKAEKKQVSQAEAMNKLADAMERMVKSGSAQPGGFFDRLINGFLGGIMASKQFRAIMINLRIALNHVGREAVRMGKAFVEHFPGVKEMFGAIADMFSPAKFKGFFTGIADEFIKFFKGLRSGTYSFPEFMENIKKKFLNYFSGNAAEGSTFLKGFKDFFSTIIKIVAEAVKWISKKMAEGMKFLTGIIKGDIKLGGGGLGGATSVFSEMFAPLWPALMEAKDMLMPALGDLFKAIGVKMAQWFKEDFLPLVKDHAVEIGAVLFGPMLLKSALGAAANSLGGKAMDKLKSMFAKKTETATPAVMATQAADKIKPKTEEQVKTAAKEAEAAKPAVSIKQYERKEIPKGAFAAEKMEMRHEEAMAAAAARHEEALAAAAGRHEEALGALGSVQEKLAELMDRDKKNKWGMQDAAKLGTKLVAIAGAIMLGGIAVALAIVAMDEILSGMDVMQVAGMMAILVAVAAAMGGILAVSGDLDKGSIGILFGSLLAIAVGLGIGGIAVAGALWAMDEILSGMTAGQIAGMMGILTGLMFATLTMVEATKGLGLMSILLIGGILLAIAGALYLGGNAIADTIVTLWAKLLIVPKESILGIMGILTALIAAGAVMAGASKELSISSAIAAGVLLFTIAQALNYGGTAVAEAILKMHFLLVALTATQIAGMMTILTGVAFASEPLGKAIAATGKFSLGSILKGGLAIGAMLYIVSWGAKRVAEALSGFEPAKLDSAGKFMLSMSLVFLSMVPLILGAVAVGALVSGPWGLIIAAMALGGLAIISDAVMEMTNTAKDVMVELGKLPSGGGLDKKVDMFVKVMDSIQALTKILVDVIEKLGDILDDLDDEEEIAAAFSGISGVIGAIVGKKGDGTGLIGIIDAVSAAMKDLSMSKDMEKAGELFSQAIAGVGAIAQGISPPSGYYEMITEALDEGEEARIGEIADKTANLIKTNRDAITRIVDHVSYLFDDFAEIKDKLPDEAQAKSISSIINAVSSVIKNIMPDKGMMDVFKEKIDDDEEIINIDKMNEFLDKWFLKLRTSLGPLTSGIVAELVETLGSVDVQKISSIGIVGEILKSVVELVKAVQEGMKSAGGANINIGDVEKGATVIVTSTMPTLAGIISDMSQEIRPLIDAMVGAVNTVPSDDDFKKKMETTKNLFSLIPELGKLVEMMPKKEVAEKLVSEAPEPTLSQKLSEGFEQLAEFFHGLYESDALGRLISGIKSFGDAFAMDKKTKANATLDAIGSFKTLVENLEKISKALKGVGSKDLAVNTFGVLFAFESYSALFESLLTPGTGGLIRLNNTLSASGVKVTGDLSKNMNQLKTNMDNIAKMLGDGGVLEAFSAMDVMVQQAQALSNAITGIPDIDLNAKLKTLASGLGVGGKFGYTISSDKVQINIDLAVAIDAGELESAIIMRKDSIIRDRVNQATKGTPVKLVPEIPATPTKGFVVPAAPSK